MGRIILVTGGARSGKSRFAEQLAADLGGRIAYIATARALDAEMADRIAHHRQQRPAAWPTFEAPLSAAAVVAAEAGRCDGFLLDCLTVLITNRILAREADWDNPPMELLADIEADVLVEIEALLTAAVGQPAPLIAVTNEVGCGIVPLSPLMLDILFTFNIVLAVIVLLVAVNMQRPLDFAIFPTLLLITTLMPRIT